MKKLLLSAALAVSGGAFAATWDIDSSHASANFTVKHLGVTNVNGTLGVVTGKFETDDKDITKSKIEASIDLKAIDTKFGKRDEHLRSPDFFDVEKFPTLTFKSTKIEKGAADNKLKITGDLTMHGVTKAVTLDAELTPEVKNPFNGATTRAVAAVGQLNRQDWGLKWQAPAEAVKVVGDEVKVSLEVELVKKEAAAPAAAPKKDAKK